MQIVSICITDTSLDAKRICGGFDNHKMEYMLNKIFSGVLNSVHDSSRIVDKSNKKKILRHKNVNYLLARSKRRSCYELSNEKYSARILGSTNKYLENDF